MHTGALRHTGVLRHTGTQVHAGIRKHTQGCVHTSTETQVTRQGTHSCSLLSEASLKVKICPGKQSRQLEQLRQYLPVPVAHNVAVSRQENKRREDWHHGCRCPALQSAWLWASQWVDRQAGMGIQGSQSKGRKGP